VEKDTVRAEEYYGRAILASPGDGELLSLYGKLIWDSYRDGERAKSYFDQAVYASPDDRYHFFSPS
jgi:Tfp pilus assembly protein PilF